MRSPGLAFLILPFIFVSTPEGWAKETAMQKATFAGGCFWGMEQAFGELEGVVSKRVGYTGGKTVDPTYEEVCTGRTGHAEAVEIVYDPSKTTYEKLLEFFWLHHNPTTLNRQGNDVGTQYRSAIFYHDETQKKVALDSKNALDRSGVFRRAIVTQIEPAGPFYPAEEEHQKYLKKNPGGYCDIQLQPEKVRAVLRAAREG